jgi:hypothetical protein
MVAPLSLPFFRHARAFPGKYLLNQFMNLFTLANCRQIYTVESNQGLPQGDGGTSAFQPCCPLRIRSVLLEKNALGK